MPVLGYCVEDGKEVVLTDAARRQGVYIIGTTGTGKTTLLKTIACQDMRNGDGICLLDPHGDMVDELLMRVPPERRGDVIVFDPGAEDQFDQPLGLNLFDCDRSDPRQRRRVAATILDTLYKLFSYSWGPRMEDLLRNSILTLLEKPETTLLDLWLLLASPKHRKYYTTDISDVVLNEFWKQQFAMYMPKSGKRAIVSRELLELVGSSLNKIGRFLTDPVIRNVIAQPQSSFRMSDIMNEGKILLVNLSKGDLGEDNSSLLGAVLVNQVLIGALQRRSIPPLQRRRFHLIVDEYQNFATAAFPTLQSEARKYAIDVIVAHQYRDQLDDLNKGSTLNVANFIVMRVSGRDSYELASQFDNTPPEADRKKEPFFEKNFDMDGSVYYTEAKIEGTGEKPYDEVELPRRAYNDVQSEQANDLSTLEDYRALCRLFIEHKPQEFTIETIDPEVRRDLCGVEDIALRNDIRQNSLSLGTPRRDVEDYIRDKIGSDIEFNQVALIPDED